MSNRELKFMKNAKNLKNVKKSEDKETGTGDIENIILNEELSSETIYLPVSKDTDEQQTSEQQTSENENESNFIEECGDQRDEENPVEHYKIHMANDELEIKYVTLGDICLKSKSFWIITYRICTLTMMLTIIIILLSR